MIGLLSDVFCYKRNYMNCYSRINNEQTIKFVLYLKKYSGRNGYPKSLEKYREVV